VTFPAYANLLADGRGQGRDRDTERSPFDDGLVRQEKRFRSALLTRRVRGWLDDADRDRFEAWAEESAHTWFDWRDLGQTATRTMRVRDGAGGIRYTSRVRDGRLTWDFELELEGPP